MKREDNAVTIMAATATRAGSQVDESVEPAADFRKGWSVVFFDAWL